jgi:hypothetical protein
MVEEHIDEFDDDSSSPVRTENGAKAEIIDDDPLLVLSTQVQGAGKSEIKELTLQVLKDAKNVQDIVDLFLLVYHTRDCRGGKGMRDLPLQILHVLLDDLLPVVLALLEQQPHFGMWQDLNTFVENTRRHKSRPQVRERVVELYVTQLKADSNNDDMTISLAAKYVPVQGKASDRKTNFLSKDIAASLFPLVKGPSHKKYESFRQFLKPLRAKINLPETQMCQQGGFADLAKRFSTIPSRCLQRNKLSILNVTKEGAVRWQQDEVRVECANAFKTFLKNPATKLKGAQSDPIKFTKQILEQEERGDLGDDVRSVINKQYTSIRDDVKAQIDRLAMESDTPLRFDNIVPLCDVSGSMGGVPLQAAIFLSIMLSELTSESFQNRILTFETAPQWLELKAKASYCSKVVELKAADWEGSTDFYKAIQQIGKIVLDSSLKPDQIPTLFVFSDMEFDDVCAEKYETVYENCKKLFANIGNQLGNDPYDPPTIIFWNLRNSTPTFPVKSSQKGVVLMSGYSASLLKFVLSGKLELDKKPNPSEALRTMLQDPRLDPIRGILTTENCQKAMGAALTTIQKTTRPKNEHIRDAPPEASDDALSEASEDV